MSAADELHQNLTLFTHSLFHTDTLQSLRVYCDGRCDGLIVIAPCVGSPLVAALQERGIPFILIGDTGDNESISCVDVDNSSAAYQLVEYLLQSGHRRIAFIGGPDFVRSSQQRLESYRRALTDYHAPLDAALEAVNVIHPEMTAHWVMGVMQLPASRRPTAIFGWNDAAAGYAAAALQNLGLRIPLDVSLAGFDDLEAFSVLPALTTVKQPYRTIGRSAVELLMAQIRSTVSEPQCLLLPGELILRGSTAPPKSQEYR